MDKKEIAELILFIVIQIVGLIPLGISFLVKRTSDDPKTDPAVVLTKNYMIRGMMIFIAAFPLYFLLTDKRTIVVIAIVLLQVLNTLMFRYRK